MKRKRIRARIKHETDTSTTPSRPKHSGPTLLECVHDPDLFAPWFKDPTTWRAWFAFIAALFALPMTPEQLATYRQCTGRSDPPSTAASEASLICGRRAGKSFTLALIAVYLAAFRDYAPYLAPGERATILVLASDRRQARVIFRYVRALLTRVALLARMIVSETKEGIDLNNFVTIEIGSASFRSVRGLTFAAVLADETAFWMSDDSANPDYEILNAVRPGLVTIPGAVLLLASSPYARRGVLWDSFKRHHGKDGDPVLVWKAGSRTMNETLPARLIEEAYERDPSNAAAEFGAEFRTDIESFIAREAIDACVADGVRERPPADSVIYRAFVDPSGGAGDSFTLAICHRGVDQMAILDAIRERKPPFSPEDVVSEFAALLKSYGVSKVYGDRYAGEFPRELFRKCGITYEPTTRGAKSDLYRELLPLINSRKVEFLDHPKLVTQLVGLERRTARSGKDSIDHAPHGHDDIANAVAGVVAHVKHGGYDLAALVGDDDFDVGKWQRSRLHNFISTLGGRFR
jgi:hypothetical protein